MLLISKVVQTAWGWVGLTASADKLYRVTLPMSTLEEARRYLQTYHPQVEEEDSPHPILGPVATLLQRYFQGDRVHFDVPLAFEGLTPFQTQVLSLTREIPYGHTLTYGELARELGKPGASRAVGQALARNPWPIVVPCHRVVGRNGKLTGFGGGLSMKERLLRLEGAVT